MAKPRFSLRGLLVGTALVALACGALVAASERVANLVLGATLLALLAATVGAAVRRGRPQAFWLGFAIVGWGYLLIVHAPLANHDTNRSDASWCIRPEGPIPTTRLLVWFYDRWLNPFEPASQPPGKATQGGGFFGRRPTIDITFVQMGGMIGGGMGNAPASLPPTSKDGPLLHDFLRVGQSIFALVFAFCGGLLGLWFYERNERRP